MRMLRTCGDWKANMRASSTRIQVTACWRSNELKEQLSCQPSALWHKKHSPRENFRSRAAARVRCGHCCLHQNAAVRQLGFPQQPLGAGLFACAWTKPLSHQHAVREQQCTLVPDGDWTVLSVRLVDPIGGEQPVALRKH